MHLFKVFRTYLIINKNTVSLLEECQKKSLMHAKSQESEIVTLRKISLSSLHPFQKYKFLMLITSQLLIDFPSLSYFGDNVKD